MRVSLGKSEKKLSRERETGNRVEVRRDGGQLGLDGILVRRCDPVTVSLMLKKKVRPSYEYDMRMANSAVSDFRVSNLSLLPPAAHCSSSLNFLLGKYFVIIVAVYYLRFTLINND
ncbi:hypothetical protein Pfo_017660 [Paulownia fortunei]|nr:hypothetical protein Pfo_017660 [Paulownia fortunei]